MADPNRRLDGVFEGGGVKGIALVGAAAVMEERGYHWENLAGTSAGAIVATLLAAGYSAAELRTIMMGLDFNKFKDGTWASEVPGVGQAFEIFKDLGIYKGDYFLNLMRQWLSAKGVRTFADLLVPGEADPRYKFKVQMIASDISRGRMLVLPGDVTAYGLAPEDFEVALAVRMSMSIPYFFRPVKLPNTAGQTCVIVDGGILSNFPIELFDVAVAPQWPTFGFCLLPHVPPRSPAEPVIHPVLGALTELWAIFNTAMEAHDAYYMSMPDISARTIKIDSLGIGTTDFQITAAQTAALYESGRTAATTFLQTWDFAEYKARYRSGQFDARRQAVLARPATTPLTVPAHAPTPAP